MGKDDKLILIFMRDDGRIRQYEFRHIWLHLAVCSLTLLVLSTVSITASAYFQWSKHMEIARDFTLLQEQIFEKQLHMEKMQQMAESHVLEMYDEKPMSDKVNHQPIDRNGTSVNLSRLFAHKDLNIVSVRDLQAQPRGRELQLRFELHNFTDNPITGKISVYLIDRTASTFQLQGKDDELIFSIRNFRKIYSLMELPSGLNLEEAFGLRLTISSKNNQELFTQVYIVSDILDIQ